MELLLVVWRLHLVLRGVHRVLGEQSSDRSIDAAIDADGLHGAALHDAAWYDAAWYDAARYAAAGYDAARYDAARYATARHDAARHVSADSVRFAASSSLADRPHAARREQTAVWLQQTHGCAWQSSLGCHAAWYGDVLGRWYPL